MAKELDDQTARGVREDARRLEAESGTTDPYPDDTRVTRPNHASRMFNVRLTDEQYDELQLAAQRRHLPMSTMARSWLLERLDQERRAG